jgi:hypothetical protein
MKTLCKKLLPAVIAMATLFTQCSNPAAEEKKPENTLQAPAIAAYGGFESQEKWGEHLVLIGGCNDCHTPKKMGPQGPEPDMSLMLSGHPAQNPPPDIDRKLVESKGLVVTDMLTAWVGPWGVSYTANLTSDATGIGNWQEENFMTAIRHGKLKGIESGRPLLPPMPWQMIANMTDDEMKAVFAFLKSTKPIQNVVPAPLPPVMAAAK